VSIGHRRFRAAIYHYVDIGTDGRSDPRYVKQVNSGASDGGWFVERKVVNATQVIRGGQPENRLSMTFHFGRAAPLIGPTGQNVYFVMKDTLDIYRATSVAYQRDNNGFNEYEVQADLVQDKTTVLFATYSDGYYYPDS
jgi:hypothetical protein